MTLIRLILLRSAKPLKEIVKRAKETYCVGGWCRKE